MHLARFPRHFLAHLPTPLEYLGRLTKELGGPEIWIKGGMTKVIETVRQLRGEAHPAVQVPQCDLGMSHGTGGMLDRRHGCATAIFERV